jgi:hypothetical protein
MAALECSFCGAVGDGEDGWFEDHLEVCREAPVPCPSRSAVLLCVPPSPAPSADYAAPMLIFQRVWLPRDFAAIGGGGAPARLCCEWGTVLLLPGACRAGFTLARRLRPAQRMSVSVSAGDVLGACFCGCSLENDSVVALFAAPFFRTRICPCLLCRAHCSTSAEDASASISQRNGCSALRSMCT